MAEVVDLGAYRDGVNARRSGFRGPLCAACGERIDTTPLLFRVYELLRRSGDFGVNSARTVRTAKARHRCGVRQLRDVLHTCSEACERELFKRRVDAERERKRAAAAKRRRSRDCSGLTA